MVLLILVIIFLGYIPFLEGRACNHACPDLDSRRLAEIITNIVIPVGHFLNKYSKISFYGGDKKPSKGLEPSLCHYFDRFYVCLRPLVFTLSCFTLPRGIPVTNHAVLDHQVVQSLALEVNSKFCPEQKH